MLICYRNKECLHTAYTLMPAKGLQSSAKKQSKINPQDHPLLTPRQKSKGRPSEAVQKQIKQAPIYHTRKHQDS